MKRFKVSMTVCCSLICLLIGAAASPAEYPTPKEGDWLVRDFRFHTGEVLPELRLHYRTVGAPTGEQCSFFMELPGRVRVCSRLHLPVNCSDPDSR